MRCEEEMEILISSDQIAIYEKSEDVRNAIKLFGEYALDPCPVLTRQDYCCMRDYMLWQIAFAKYAPIWCLF